MLAGGAIVCRMCRSGWMSLNLRASASSVVAFAGSRRTMVQHGRNERGLFKSNDRRRGLANGFRKAQWLNVLEVGCVCASSEFRKVFLKSRRYYV